MIDDNLSICYDHRFSNEQRRLSSLTKTKGAPPPLKPKEEKMSKKILRALQTAFCPPEAVKSILLRPLAPVAIKFVAADYFKEGNTAGVKFSDFGNNFVSTFLGKVEMAGGPITIVAHELTQNSLDAPIIAELGDRHKTTLKAFWELLKKQPQGEDGVLLTDGLRQCPLHWRCY